MFLHRTIRDGRGAGLGADRARLWLSRSGIRRRIERALGVMLIALGIELAADPQLS